MKRLGLWVMGVALVGCGAPTKVHRANVHRTNVHGSNLHGTNVHGDAWQHTLAHTPEPTRSDVRYIMQHTPPEALEQLGAPAAVRHAEAMRSAWKSAPWSADVSETLWRAAVLPPTHVSEMGEDWHDVLAGRLVEVAPDSECVEETVRALNAAIGQTLSVHYHPTKRRAPDQGPLETMESGWSSCTGLSILLADACRTRGIPARLAGTPLWVDESGNHTWVEVWAEGRWHHVESADAKSWDSAWFDAKAGQADELDPMHRIYAVMPGGPEVFPMAWDPDRTDIRGVDVTARYATTPGPVREGEDAPKATLSLD